MIDFKKLMNRTPEEKEADRLAIEARYAEMESVELAKIATRSAQVVALHEGNYPLDAFERKFISSLQYKATTFDMTGREGGNLAFLSDKQMEILNRLAAKHLPASEEQPEADVPAKRAPRP